MNSNILKQIIMMSKYAVFGIIIQCFCFSLLIAEKGSAQTKSVEQIYLTLHIEHNEIEEVFKQISNETDFDFIYSNNLLEKKKKINLNADHMSLGDILRRISQKTGLQFKRVDQDIIVSQRSPRSEKVVEVYSLHAERQVAGKVIDESGEGLPGVNVILKGTSIGTVTDINGDYSLEVPDEGAVLIFSSVGYIQEEIMVGNQSVIDVSMVPDIKALEEIVVIGYGTQKKVNLTGAVESVDSEVLESRPITNLGQGLQGVIPNLNINMPNGAPGKGATFNVRGGTSINGGNPLVLVDGVQMDPNLINPGDIESISVLKDAASAAVYGARAPYGVILITTKSGKKQQKMSLTYNGNMAFNRPTRLPEYVNSLDYVNMMNTANLNSGAGAYFNDEYVNHVKNYLSNPIPENAVFIDPNNSDRYLYSGNTDWIDVIYDDYASVQQHALSLNGGTEKTSYYASIGLLDQGGFLTYFDEVFNRYNANISISTDVTDWLTFSAKTIYNYTEKNSPYANIWSNGEDFGFISGDLRPLMPVYHPDGNFSGQGSWTNMAAMGELSGTRNRKINDFWLSGALQLKPVDDLLINLDYTTNFYSNVHKAHRKEIVEHYANPDVTTLYPWTKPSSVGLDQADDYYSALNLWGQYEKTKDRHYFKVMVGFNQEYKHNRWFSSSRNNLINNDFGALNQAIGEQFVNFSESEWAIRGVFYRLNYIFDDKYLVELNGRYDGSSKFPSEDRFKFFPSGSVGWRVSNEGFFESFSSVVDDLKIRASYGFLGNQNVDENYPYIATLGSSSQSGYIINGQQPVAIHPSGLVSASLTWETVSQLNFGLDLGLFENRLKTTFDWYARNTEDMLTSGQPLPAILGTSVPRENAADLTTKGWELSMSWEDGINNDFNYHFSVVLSDYQTEITKFDNPEGLLNRYYVGRKFDEIWGYTTEKLFQTEEEVLNAPDQSRLWGGQWTPGDVRYRDINEDGKIDWGENTLDDHGDLSIIGNSTPRYSYGIRGGFDWRNFSFLVFFQGIGKRDYMPGGNYFWGLTNQWMVPQQHSLDYWTEENTDAYWFRPRFGHGGNYQTQTRYLQDASYIRLKQLTIGYNIPQSLIGKWNIQNVRIYFTGENLWEHSGILDAYDPEILDARTYPLYRTLSLGLNITL
ncbi:MAG: TonB-dependent receptor [Cytophagales bacterium]|nr:TonB-dependent receptor [Cytophagales bacterium]